MADHVPDPFGAVPAHRTTWVARLEQLAVLVSALVCLLFTAGLRDVSIHALWPVMQRAPTLPEDTARGASLRLLVTNDDGTPSSGALVRVFTVIGEEVFTVGGERTGPDGEVVIDDLPPGETWVVVQQRDRARSSTWLVLEEGERQLEMQLGPAARLEVVVVDPLDKPIVGVTVAVHTRDPLPFVGRTGARGAARFGGLPDGLYTVEVSAAGYDTKVLEEVTVEDSPIFVRLERSAALEIQVLTPLGTPAAGATVLVAGASLWPARSATTDEAGRVTIDGLGRGFYDLRAESGDLVSDSELGVMLEQGERKSIVLHLIQGTYVTVTVTDGEGEGAKPIPSADVSLVEGGISSFPRYGRTDETGVVRIGPVAGVEASVSARAEGFVPRSAIKLEEGQSEVRIALTRGAKLIGRVIDDRDYPVDGATLEVIGVDSYGMPIVESSSAADFTDQHFAFALPGATPLIPTGELGVMPVVPDIPRGGGPIVIEPGVTRGNPWVSHADGSFTLTPVTPGRVQIIARHPSYVQAISDPIEVGVGETIDDITIVMQAGGILEGRVVEEDGTPVAGARLEVSSQTRSLGRVTYTADDGTFAFAAMPNLVTVSVARADALEHEVAREVFEVPPDDRREVEIVLREPREEVEIRVVDDLGYAVEDVEVHASSLIVEETLIKTLFTDENGEATLPAAQDLPLRIWTRKRGWAPSVVEIDSAPPRIEVAMVPGVTLTGTVEARRGYVEGANVTLLSPTGDRDARTDEEGRFSMEDLAPVEHRILIRAPGYVPFEDWVLVDDDGNHEFELPAIELEEAGGVKGTIVDRDGEPVAGVLVARGRVPSFLPLGPLSVGIAQTDSEGKFTLDGLPEGLVALETSKVGYFREVVDVDIRAGDETDVEIELEADDLPPDDRRAQGTLAATLGGEGGFVELVHVPFGSEAQRAGLLAGDQLLAIDGFSVRSLGDARRRLDGPLSRDIVLELARAPDLRWRVRVRRERVR